MLQGWLLIGVSLLYVGLLFGIAYHGDQRPELYRQQRFRVWVFSLSLAVYCTSWTFYGAVGRAALDGIGFFPIYLGPSLMLLFGAPILYRVIQIAKRHNSTSIADFIATRYGKSPSIAALVTLIAVVGTLPYIALQLKAVSMGYNVLTLAHVPDNINETPVFSDTAIYVALMMAVFTILFGTRHLDATEHHEGMMQAIAFESIVKLVALVAVGLFACSLMLKPDLNLWGRLQTEVDWPQFVWQRSDGLAFWTQTLVAALAIFLLPRQFHTMVVENCEPRDMRTARWLMPLYLMLTSLFVLPIAAVGTLVFPNGTVDGDTFVLSLPLVAGRDWLTVLAFIGGGSAATGMVIVSTVALSTMVCNEWVVPLLLRLSRGRLGKRKDLSSLLLGIRRGTIVILLLLAYGYYRLTGEFSSLTAIGLLSFVAAAQFAPALLGGVLWRRGNRQGAIAGLLIGTSTWVYCLLVPALAKAGWIDSTLVDEGLFAWSWLRPTQLLGMAGPDPITHGALWSLALNSAAYVLVSLVSTQRLRERIQVASFFELAHRDDHALEVWRGSATLEDLQVLAERFLGPQRTRACIQAYLLNAELRGHAEKLHPKKPASREFIKFIESQLAAVIGSSTARVVVDSTLKGREVQLEDVVSIVDEATQAIQFSRELLQSALENISMGVSVIDSDLRLVAWNRRYLDLFDYPKGFVEVGRPIEDLVRYNLERTSVPPEKMRELVAQRLHLMREGTSHEYERTRPDSTVLLIQGNPLPGGGFVTTFSDITARRRAETALRETNTYLEQRVRERTEELEELNRQLIQAKAQADSANQGKTRFLASASHDLMQPLNAARLFLSALTPRLRDSANSALDDQRELLDHLDHSLTAAEEILSTLLDISKLDAGVLEPRISDFCIGDLLRNLSAEFSAIAADQGLQMDTVMSQAVVRSDLQLLRRVVQNLLSNAIRYTRRGRVLLGCRRTREGLRIEVWDTGPGIPEDHLQTIFEEFKRLSHGQHEKKGLGLGLAIVERIGRMLKHPVTVRSWQGQGSVFSMTVPYGERVTAQSLPAKAARAPGSMEGVRVLCIDNERSVLNGMRALLQSWHVEVRCALGPEDVMSQVNGWHPDLLLADYQLDDGANGLDLLDRLRGRLQPAPPGLLITALMNDSLKDDAKSRGYWVVNKPVKPAVLRAMMQRMVLRR